MCWVVSRDVAVFGKRNLEISQLLVGRVGWNFRQQFVGHVPKGKPIFCVVGAGPLSLDLTLSLWS
jgi:hypothetical protein